MVWLPSEGNEWMMNECLKYKSETENQSVENRVNKWCINVWCVMGKPKCCKVIWV